MKKIKHSTFMLTINTNKTQNDVDMNKFISSLKYLLKLPNIYGFIRDKTTGKNVDPSKIINIKMKFASEIGKKDKKVHAHALIDVDHMTMLEVNGKNIREFYKNWIGDNIHLDIKAGGNSTKYWEEYMLKDSDTVEI